MNIDIRLSLDFFDHPKTMKLQRRCGLEGVHSLMRLWCWAANYRPKGNLDGIENEDIEIAAKWHGKNGTFIKALLEIGFLDQTENGLYLHNWDERQCYAIKSDERSEVARNAAKTRWSKKKNDAPSNAPSMPEASEGQCKNNAPSNAKRMKNAMLNRCPLNHNTINHNLKENTLSNKELINTPARAYETEAEEGEREIFSFESIPEEFSDLRRFYSENCRAESPVTGLAEWLKISPTKLWPGSEAIKEDIRRRIEAKIWDRGYWPSFVRYLNERTWAAPITPKESSQDGNWIIPEASWEREARENAASDAKQHRENYQKTFNEKSVGEIWDGMKNKYAKAASNG